MQKARETVVMKGVNLILLMVRNGLQGKFIFGEKCPTCFLDKYELVHRNVNKILFNPQKKYKGRPAENKVLQVHSGYAPQRRE